MMTFDLNADLGEIDTPDGRASDAAILSVVSSASIACGGHAGNAETMARAVRVARDHGVRIGAHPAYPDPDNFGRQSGYAISPDDLRQSLADQILTLVEIAAEQRAEVAYVKPHGALYNDAVIDDRLAELIADVVRAIDPDLGLMGAPDSALARAGETRHLDFIAEGFIDRRYSDAGHLVPRAQTGAVLATDADRLAQLNSLVCDAEVTTDTGGRLAIGCRTLCLHGDSPGAMDTARAARSRLEKLGYTVRA